MPLMVMSRKGFYSRIDWIKMIYIGSSASLHDAIAVQLVSIVHESVLNRCAIAWFTAFAFIQVYLKGDNATCTLYSIEAFAHDTTDELMTPTISDNSLKNRCNFESRFPAKLIYWTRSRFK